MLEVLTHKKFLHYFIISTLFLLIGSITAMMVNLPPLTPSEFNFQNSPISTMTIFQVFQEVLIQNLAVTFLIISFGLFCTRIIPIGFMFINGYNIGSLFALLNYNPIVINMTIFPHGYIEFPLMIMTGTISFILIYELKQSGMNAISLLKRHKNKNIKYILANYLFYPYLIIIIPWVLVAALVESIITFWNLKMVIGL